MCGPVRLLVLEVVLGMGGLGREKPFHTERTQSARVAFMAAGLMILQLRMWAQELSQNMYDKICECGCYGQDFSF